MNGRFVKLLSAKEFKTLQLALDLEMKTSTAQGLGMNVKQSDPVTSDMEDILWEKGILGSHSPRSLLRTVFWLIGVNYGIRGGEEQRKLTQRNFSFGEDDQGSFLLFKETVSKTHQGGLKHKGAKPREAKCYQNEEPHKCLVNLFRKYINLCAPEMLQNGLYLRPLASISDQSKLWYAKQYVGHNTLKRMVSDMMTEAGLGDKGHFTNHSLRASTATRLFRGGVDEQLIAGQTGHRSLKALRV